MLIQQALIQHTVFSRTAKRRLRKLKFPHTDSNTIKQVNQIQLHEGHFELSPVCTVKWSSRRYQALVSSMASSMNFSVLSLLLPSRTNDQYSAQEHPASQYSLTIAVSTEISSIMQSVACTMVPLSLDEASAELGTREVRGARRKADLMESICHVEVEKHAKFHSLSHL